MGVMVVLFAVGFSGSVARGQAPAERTTPIGDLDPTRQPGGDEGSTKTTANQRDPGGTAVPIEDEPDPSVSEELLRGDPEVRSAFKAMLVRKYKREAEILDERRSVLRWTDGVSRGIFVVVHVVLLIGLWAAVREFRHAEQTRKEAKVARLKADGEPSEFKIGLEGIALKTSLHGLLILGAAIGFYFMYLKFVYPVTVLP